MIIAIIRFCLAISLICVGLYINVSPLGETPVIWRILHIPSLILVVTGVAGVGLLMSDFHDLKRFCRGALTFHQNALKRARQSERDSEALFQTFVDSGPQVFSDKLHSGNYPAVWQIVGAKLSAKLPFKDIKKILIHHANLNSDRIDEDIAILKRLAGLAPSIGMFGSILGLVKMLANLKDFDSLGPNMSLVLLSTLYGILFGSMILTPLIQKVEARRHLLLRNHKNIMNWLTGLEENQPAFYMKGKLAAMVRDDER